MEKTVRAKLTCGRKVNARGNTKIQRITDFHDWWVYRVKGDRISDKQFDHILEKF